MLTMYQTPRMMVPVRTWKHRQQLVEYQRSHGDIIIIIFSVRIYPLEALMNDNNNKSLSDARARSLPEK